MRTIEKIIRELILVTLFSCVSLGYSQKYWVGGQGKWSDENHWSKTSGGVGGSVIPNEYQEAIFDKNSGLKYLDSVVVDGYAEVKSLNFSSLPFPIIFKGSESSSLFITDKIFGEAKFVNQFNGMVHMDGSESNYRYKMFDSGEFYGKQSFFDVYEDVYADFQTLSITSVDTILTNSTCGGDNGSIVVKNIVGGGPFGFQWYPAFVDGNNTDSIYNLPAGIYTCVITDSSDFPPSIFRLRNLNISGTQPLYIFGQSDSTQCNGSSDGTIQATINEGTQPYTYIWSDTAAQNNMSVVSTDAFSQEILVENLSTGVYNLTIIDAEGCSDSVPGGWTVHEPTILSSLITSAEDVLCFSECTGEATVTPSGGTPVYSYNWYDAPGSQVSAEATGLCESTYHVEVSDANGCLDTSEVVIGQPTLLDGFIADFEDEQCFGASDGTASAGVNGGTYPYSYNWYNKGGDTDSAATGFPPGTFNVQITDANGCLDTAQVTISGPTLLTSSMVDVVHVLCESITSASDIERLKLVAAVCTAITSNVLKPLPPFATPA